jgi:hypothetical protein
MASKNSNGNANKTMMDKDGSSWKYLGEYGRVSAWVKRTHRDLELEKDIYGHPPPVVFEKRAEKLIQQEAIDVPPGFEAPAIGHFYVTEADGTPKTKRHLSFTPATQEQEQAEGAGVGNEGDAAGTVRPNHIERSARFGDNALQHATPRRGPAGMPSSRSGYLPLMG